MGIKAWRKAAGPTAAAHFVEVNVLGEGFGIGADNGSAITRRFSRANYASAHDLRGPFPVIRAQIVRDLNLSESTDSSQGALISAASGLVKINDALFVVADDEHHLGVFSNAHHRPGELIRLLAGALPANSADRKLRKPDLETLTHLPAFEGFPAGALLAMGSGSTADRDTGVLLGINAGGQINTSPRTIDFSALYNVLRQDIHDLNIEGAVALHDQLILLQRGSKAGPNALVTIALKPFLQDLSEQNPPRAHARPRMQVVDLGDIDGIPLCFTDATPLPDGQLLFAAAAEDTANSVDDGACGGSIIGVLDTDGRVRQIARLDIPCKVEGVTATIQSDAIELLMVTDADDATRAAWLLSAVVPYP